MRLGLIEARAAVGVYPLMLECIRGACASASLKRDINLAEIDVLRRYPRRMRLGLIEALQRQSCFASG